MDRRFGVRRAMRSANDIRSEDDIRSDMLSMEESTKVLMRAWTLTVLEQLDGSRKRAVMRILSEAQALEKAGGLFLFSSAEQQPIRLLNEADFCEADLTGMNFTDKALSGVRLTRANLANTELSGADLSEADLTGAQLGTARRMTVRHDGTTAPAPPNPAYLRQADLRNADLSNTMGWTYQQWDRAKSLQGATMPNGQKYEDWLKSKGRRDDRENGDPS